MLNVQIDRLLLTGLLVFTLFLLFSCEADNPGAPLPNQPPDTYISVASPGSVTTISWYGTDKDGFAEVFYYQWDGEAEWTRTEELSATFNDIFASMEETRTFFVYAEDNTGTRDQTPASVTLSPSNTAPETIIDSGPEFGSITGEDVTYTFSGKDFDIGGEVVAFEYALDDLDTWTEVNADAAQAVFRGLDAGSHTFYVKAIDNLGAEDSTPVAASFIVKSGTFKPIITNTSPVANGGGWFAGAAIAFSFEARVADYYGELAEKAFSFGFDDNTGYNENASEPLASGWRTAAEYNAGSDMVTPGEHTLYVKVRDVARSVGLSSVTFNVAAPSFDKGILLVDDFNWIIDTYNDDDEAQTNAIASGFMADYPYTLRSEDEPALTPDDLAPYSTVILYGDYGYTNQDNGNLLAAYATAGGNLFICGYNLVSIAPSFAAYGIRDAVFGLDAGNYGGMDGIEGTAYENWHIDLPAGYDDRLYQRVYSDADNTQEIFAVRGNDGDNRACGVRADMPEGNVVIVIGQSIPFWDQSSPDTKAFGEYVLGTEFGESK
ncbi:hypothetical protein JW960_12395 [candidate division KSB1 bacterium]|nr:hypothetical protein [candidate division KSB1 bacterium]